MSLLEFSDCGIYCSKGGFYIDPWKPVDKAIITHAHSDHARWGNRFYLTHSLSAPIMRYRLGADINLQTVEFGEVVYINGVKVSFHPAGHIVGSAQIRVESDGEVWVASGDYKLEDDGLSGAIEVVKCHAFITESTFGMPIYKWESQKAIFDEVNKWWAGNIEKGKASVICGYALGKAQRIIQHLDSSIGPIYTHGAVENVNEAIRASGIPIQGTTRVTPDISKEEFRKSIIVAVPSALSSPWIRKFQPYSSAIASGWMALRGAKRRKAVDRGFVLSDHADWESLNKVVKETGAEKVYVTHGYKSAYSRWLREQGLDAHEVDTLYEGESLEESEVASEETPLVNKS
jgi:putative mRNA 3-end processing factor